MSTAFSCLAARRDDVNATSWPPRVYVNTKSRLVVVRTRRRRAPPTSSGLMETISQRLNAVGRRSETKGRFTATTVRTHNECFMR